jgi:hypothetical protein
LVNKTDAALEALGEGRGTSTSTPPAQSTPRPHVEKRSAKDTRRAETTRALAAQLKARLLAAEKVGNVKMATDTRKKLAALLTQKL